MIKPGIKIGLNQNNWQENLKKSGAEFTEIYFLVSNYKAYNPIFAYLREKGIKFGLHFWGKLKGNFMPDLVQKGPVADESVKLIKETIDIAKREGARYVNIHPGSFLLKKVDFKLSRFLPTSKKISFPEGRKELTKNVRILHEYARSRKVLLLLETLCKYEPDKWLWSKKGLKPSKGYLSFNINSDLLYSLAIKEGIFITNDFGHTLTETMGKDRGKIFNSLYLKTKKLAPFTKLIHSNTNRPPFNGIDSHAGLLSSDFKAGVLPNRKELISLFQIFKNQSNVWAIPEPMENHVANFKALKSLLKKAFQQAETSPAPL